MSSVTHSLCILMAVKKAGERMGLAPDIARRNAELAVSVYRRDGNALRAADDGRRMAKLIADRVRGPQSAA